MVVLHTDLRAPKSVDEPEQLLLQDVAKFIDSDGAILFAVTAKEFGLDPAEEIDDPWLAWQLRIGLLARLRHHDVEQTEKQKNTRIAKRDEHNRRMDVARQVLAGR